MNKDVIISITGTQTDELEETETIELITNGQFSERNGIYSVSYVESEMTGLEGTTTTFEVAGNRIILTREGTVQSQMIFEEGRKHISLYDMGFGALTVGVSARRVRSNLSDVGGTIEIDYAIEIDHEVAGENLFRIQVRESGINKLLQ